MRRYLIVLFSLLSLSASAQGVNDHTPNSRIAAMGGASVAAKGDAFAIFDNTASALMEYKSVQVAFSYAKFAGEQYSQNRMFAAGTYVRFAQKHALLAGAQFNMEPTVGNSGRPGVQTFNLSYGYKINNSLSLAATARYHRGYGYMESAQNYNGGGADVAIYSVVPLSFKQGATLNIGGKAAFDTPTCSQYGRYTFAIAAGIGLSIPFSDAHMLDFTSEIKYGAAKGGDIIAARLGAEYSLMRLFYFRAGGNITHIAHNITLPYGTVGLGVRFFHLQFDVAYIAGKRNTPLHNALQFNFGLDF